MTGIKTLFELQAFLVRSSLPCEFTVTLAKVAWDSLFEEAAQAVDCPGWMSREKVEVMGTIGDMRIVGPHGYITIRHDRQ